MSITAAIIARNSSDVIERCLESVKDCDEIVVLDTGSTDNTMDIARKYTDKVYEYWGCNEGGKKDGLLASFADARNECNKYATSKYILTIDCDEVLETPVEKLKKVTENSLSILCTSAHTGEQHRQPRLYINHKDVYWKGPAHNYLVGVGPGIYSNYKITYYTNKQKKKDPDRTLRILENFVKNNKDKDCVREMYYLSKEYLKRKRNREAIRMLKKYIKLSKFYAEKTDAFVMLARCLVQEKDYKGALNAGYAALNINPCHKEALNLMGDMSTDANRLKWRHLARNADNGGVLFIRPEKRTKVTVLSKVDFAGSGYRIVQAVREASGGDIDIEAITEQEGQGSPHFSIPTGPCILRVGQGVVQARIKDSDIIIMKGDWLHKDDWCGFDIRGKKKIYYFSGSFFRRGGHKSVSMGKVPVDRYEADFRAATTPDLCYAEDIHLMEFPWYKFDYRWKPGKRIVHIPSDTNKKGTEAIVEAMKLLPELEFVCESGISHKEAMELKSTATIYIDQMILPVYGNAAVEAMGMGIPVLSWDEGLYPYETPIIKPKSQEPEDIAEVIMNAMQDIKMISEATFEFAKLRHGTVGEKWIHVFNEMLEGQFLGSGEGRVVYAVDENKVVKVAKNDTGVDNNKKEWRIWNKAKKMKKMLVPCLDISDDGKRLTMQRGLPADKAPDYPDFLSGCNIDHKKQWVKINGKTRLADYGCYLIDEKKVY